jgi:hypothetical protein
MQPGKGRGETGRLAGWRSPCSSCTHRFLNINQRLVGVGTLLRILYIFHDLEQVILGLKLESGPENGFIGYLSQVELRCGGEPSLPGRAASGAAGHGAHHRSSPPCGGRGGWLGGREGGREGGGGRAGGQGCFVRSLASSSGAEQSRAGPMSQPSRCRCRCRCRLQVMDGVNERLGAGSPSKFKKIFQKATTDRF